MNHVRTGGSATALFSSMSRSLSALPRDDDGSRSRSRSPHGDPYRLLPLRSHRSRSWPPPAPLCCGDAPRCLFDGGPKSLPRVSSLPRRLPWSGDGGRLLTLLPAACCGWLEGKFDTIDCCVSCRPRLLAFERALLALLPPPPFLDTTKPRSCTAIASVPRYLCRSANRLIGGSGVWTECVVRIHL